ncbi:MAG: phenylalanine--tRNA ligase subunit alpha [Gammaproteobacteria bacterium]|nr:phenylalanine--tRNA ligase subunit alpha [Gammaproteobacteria bacterium]
MSTVTQRLEEALTQISACDDLGQLENIRIEWLGKKGQVADMSKAMTTLSAEEKPAFGQQLNQVKNRINQALTERKALLEMQALEARLATETIDVTLPGIGLQSGGLHPVTLATRRMTSLLSQLGFAVAEGPEIEDDFHNFEALNFPKNHPARDMHDTFFLPSGNLLRTHTSPVQVRHMMSGKPPYKVIAPGRVYRNDYDQTHSPMFHQIEGLYIDKDVSLSTLMSHLEMFLKQFFDQGDVDIRFRPSFFPFTEPSTEVDIRINKGKWMEVLGAGMVHPNVLKASGVDSSEYSGYAFGLGVERFAMLRYGVDDLRLFFENDARFVDGFK